MQRPWGGSRRGSQGAQMGRGAGLQGRGAYGGLAGGCWKDLGQRSGTARFNSSQVPVWMITQGGPTGLCGDLGDGCWG